MYKGGRSPHSRRMAAFERSFPPPIQDPIMAAHIERVGEMDLRARAGLEDLKKWLVSLRVATMAGGSGFRMAEILRYFWGECSGRLGKHGPEFFPSSFNVVEAFFKYSKEHFSFALREEREHLCRIYDYFNWYTAEAGGLIRDPSLLEAVMSDGIVYSYEMLGAVRDFQIRTPDSDIAIQGISLIRHEYELSVILVAGEKPLYPPDGQFLSEHDSTPIGNRDKIIPDPSLTVADRVVAGLPGYSQVVLLSRIDLQARRYDVRYLNLDLGPSYFVFTDDKAAFGVEQETERTTRDAMLRGLKRYEDLFSTVSALIYLPAFFVARQTDVITSTFVTELHVKRKDKDVRNAVRLMGKKYAPHYRTVHGLASDTPAQESRHEIEAPIGFQSSLEGHWKTLAHGEIGEDESGNPVVGKTWVERYDSWRERGLESFLLRMPSGKVDGPDSGILYVMRSPSHDKDVYKIGITCRDSATRANELSQPTGVPLPFGVIAQWDVRDCRASEEAIHQRLSVFRISNRREFFRAALSLIVATIEDVVSSD